MSLRSSFSNSPRLVVRGILYQLQDVLLIHIGSKCGSIHIDNEFKRWLSKVLGQHYRNLDPKPFQSNVNTHSIEGAQMRIVMKAFENLKRSFGGHDGKHMRIELPTPLEDLTLPDGPVKLGKLTITRYVQQR